jgi:Tfp pilus assembly protein PilF
METLSQRAKASSTQGNTAEAVRLWEELLARGQADVLLYNHLGLGHKKLGHLDKAEAYDRKALDLDPNNAETLNNLGVVYLEQDRLDEALAMLEKALQQNPAYADPSFHLGRLYEKQGRVVDAIRAYSVFLERYSEPNGPVGQKVRSRIEALGRPQ